MSEEFHLNHVDPDELAGPFMVYNHMEIVRADPQSSVIKVALRPESKNLHGVAHGGLLGAMADCAAGVTARAGGEDYITLSSHYSFLRNTRTGTVYAKADIVRRGRQIAVLHVTAYDENEVLLMDGSIEMIHRENRPSE